MDNPTPPDIVERPIACRHCGHDAPYIEEAPVGHHPHWWSVVCPCGMRTANIVSKAGAISIWNRRHPAHAGSEGEEVERVAHILCPHVNGEGPCSGCSIKERGPRGGMRGCILDASKVARAALAALPRGMVEQEKGLREALEELFRVVEMLDKKGNAAGIWLLIRSAMKKARAALVTLPRRQEKQIPSLEAGLASFEINKNLPDD